MINEIARQPQNLSERPVTGGPEPHRSPLKRQRPTALPAPISERPAAESPAPYLPPLKRQGRTALPAPQPPPAPTAAPAAECPAMNPRWPELARRLTRLAATLTQDARLQIAPTERWNYNTHTHVLEVPAQVLLAGDDAYNLGATCRWVGRRLYSRPVADPHMAQAAFRLLWTAVEDARTSRLLGERLAGVPTLLTAFYNDFLQAAAASGQAGQLLAALVREGVLGQRTQHPANPALDALLAQARPWLHQATAVPEDVDLQGDDLNDAQACDASAQAFAIVRDRLWPLLADALKDFAGDASADGGDAGQTDDAPEGQAADGEGQNGQVTQSNADGEAQGDAGDAADVQDAGQARPGKPSRKRPPLGRHDVGGLSPEQLDDMLKADQTTTLPPEKIPSLADAMRRKGTLEEAGDDRHVSFDDEMAALEKSARENLASPKNPVYEQLRVRHAAAIEDMVVHLGNALAREDAPQWSGMHRQGRLHMPRWIQSQLREEHTGVADPLVFQKREEPEKRSVAIATCMDCSGSMEGSNMDAARAAFVVLQEALTQLGIPYGTLAFDHKAKLLQDVGMHDEASRYQALEALKASGSNNEPAALKLAREMLAGSDATHKVVLFFTDGGAASNCKEHVEKTQRETGIQVIGIGVGEGCGEVEQIYGNHVVVPVVADLPLKMADVLRSALMRPS